MFASRREVMLGASRAALLAMHPLQRSSDPGSHYYIAPDGNDSGAGTISDPWLTLVDKINAVAQPGDTFWCRGGLYLGQRNKTLSKAGAEGSPITVRAYPGETPIFSAAYGEFRATGNSDWEVYDAGRSIYRSVNAYTDPVAAVGARMYYGGRDFNLVSYPLTYGGSTGYDYLSSDEHRWMGSGGGSFYCGPGVFWDNNNVVGQGANKIYIRLEKRSDSALRGVSMTHFPTDYDPRNHNIHIFPNMACIYASGDSSAYYLFDGIEFRDWWQCFNRHMAHWTVRNCTFVSLSHCFRNDVGKAHDNLFENNWMRIDVPRSVALYDMKSSNQPASVHVAGAFNLSLQEQYNITIRNNTIVEAFDGIGVMIGDLHDFTITGNTVGTPSGTVRAFLDADHAIAWDDCLQLTTAARNFEIAHNQICGAFLGFQGNVEPSTYGTVYVHHNYVENLTRFLNIAEIGPGVTGDAANPNWGGWQHPVIFNSHNVSGITGCPWKIYNNTFQYTPPYGDPPNAAGLDTEPAKSPNNSGVLHEVMNNIFAQVAPGPQYDVMQAVQLARYYVGEAYDGNAWWLDPAVGTRSTNDFEWLYNVFVDASTQVKYATLAAMKADTANWNASKANWEPGWENSGIDDVDPQIEAGSWQPKGAGIHSGALDLSARGWPGVDGAYRGAVNPSGGTAVGVTR